MEGILSEVCNFKHFKSSAKVSQSASPYLPYKGLCNPAEQKCLCRMASPYLYRFIALSCKARGIDV